MARAKISEFRAKTMLLGPLDAPYDGVGIDTSRPLEEQLASLPADGRFVVKVDQAIKKRMKQGLVLLDRERGQLAADLQSFADKGYRYCLVEPMFPHEQAEEHYLAFENGRDGTAVLFSEKGGIDIEEAADSVQRLPASDENLIKAAGALGVTTDFLRSLRDTFDAAYGCFLEINPFVSKDGEARLLDVAAEVDGEAGYLTRDYWSAEDFRAWRQQTPAEAAIAELASTSRASLRFEVINPDGAVFLLLSGGGASIVVADEVKNRGFGELLGNYGEYSGNPSEAETFAYTDQLLQTMLASKAPNKVLVIAGGVANFTDVRTTFTGVIRALEKHADNLAAQGVKVYVRRGGPHELEGLTIMKNSLEKHGLLGAVNGPELPLADSVGEALASLEAN